MTIRVRATLLAMALCVGTLVAVPAASASPDQTPLRRATTAFPLNPM